MYVKPCNPIISEYVTAKMAEGYASPMRGWSLSKIVSEFPNPPEYLRALDPDPVDRPAIRREVLRRCGL